MTKEEFRTLKIGDFVKCKPAWEGRYTANKTYTVLAKNTKMYSIEVKVGERVHCKQFDVMPTAKARTKMYYFLGKLANE